MLLPSVLHRNLRHHYPQHMAYMSKYRHPPRTNRHPNLRNLVYLRYMPHNLLQHQTTPHHYLCSNIQLRTYAHIDTYYQQHRPIPPLRHLHRTLPPDNPTNVPLMSHLYQRHCSRAGYHPPQLPHLIDHLQSIP